jgi:hypothetical protein
MAKCNCPQRPSSLVLHVTLHLTSHPALIHCFLALPRDFCTLQASALGASVDNTWQALGGGPADLIFDEVFLGVWDVESVLTTLDLPMGPEYVPNMKVSALMPSCMTTKLCVPWAGVHAGTCHGLECARSQPACTCHGLECARSQPACTWRLCGSCWAVMAYPGVRR